MTVDELLQRMKEMGCKLTPQRRMLIDVLLAAGEAELTADEIYQQIRTSYPEVGLDTVYRNLRLLAKMAIVDEVKLPGKLAQYSLNRKAHQHGLVCLECGKEIPLTHCPIKELETVARTEHGFVISSHHIELFGYCGTCSAADKKNIT
ncbi:MAG TPA: Fur family transcriptional regulator [Symbiobacteriaceae bacterium]|nr:Fur family transcriptional regulator [Symbiobacteriaceae bacterium]